MWGAICHAMGKGQPDNDKDVFYTLFLWPFVVLVVAPLALGELLLWIAGLFKKQEASSEDEEES